MYIVHIYLQPERVTDKKSERTSKGDDSDKLEKRRGNEHAKAFCASVEILSSH